MHIYFSGIGGTGIGPLALIAKQAGFEVSGSDKQQSEYIAYLTKHGISNIIIGQNGEDLEALHAKHPIDWVVYSSALPKENPNHPELVTTQRLGIRSSKRDEFLNFLLQEKKLKMIAIAGTHGKTTTTAMTIWLFKELGLPVSYSVGAKLGFGEMGEYDPESDYFVYEADEYDRNFLSFTPDIAIISGIGYDHPDIYPTKEEYNQAFCDFIAKSRQTYIWVEDADRLAVDATSAITVLRPEENGDIAEKLAGKVNRLDAKIVARAVHSIDEKVGVETISEILNRFPGVSRRFEKVADNIYSDYAHTPEKILGAIQNAQEVAGGNVVVVYEGLHNTRQHFIRSELETLFDGVKVLYVVPSYRAREDESLEDLTPEKLIAIMKTPDERNAKELNENLRDAITSHAKNGDLVLCLSAGGGGSLDEWLRQNFDSTLSF